MYRADTYRCCACVMLAWVYLSLLDRITNRSAEDRHQTRYCIVKQVSRYTPFDAAAAAAASAAAEKANGIPASGGAAANTTAANGNGNGNGSANGGYKAKRFDAPPAYAPGAGVSAGGMVFVPSAPPPAFNAGIHDAAGPNAPPPPSFHDRSDLPLAVVVVEAAPAPPGGAIDLQPLPPRSYSQSGQP